ncbi:hypothetical protein DZK27_14440 [Rhodobacteraceae bacterium 63075]|nr:hypothetical protein DZK27_14440 [Rhodobacteraceae bacterium 63075]
MEETPQSVDPALLRYLKTLVTALTGVMIVGLVAVVWLLVTRLSADVPPLPERITLPAGARAQAFTQGEGWFAVVTEDARILIFGRDGATLLQEIEISTPD